MSKVAEKQIRRVPKFIKEAVYICSSTVEKEGIWNIRKIPGYHDEPLKGKRSGQRSVRISRSYRLIYTESEANSVIEISVVEANKHEY